jgi:ketosteroid isomerase-like protein
LIYVLLNLATKLGDLDREALNMRGQMMEDADMRLKNGGIRKVLIGSLAALISVAANANTELDQKAVATLDTDYQAAVKNNDATTMDRILADDFVVVTGTGKIYTKADLLNMARSNRVIYEHQDESDQTVRVWGDTAVVTAKLWGKGLDAGKHFDWQVWFSDTYVRTPSGWRYVHGQASLPLPATEK